SISRNASIPAGDAVADLDGDGLPEYLLGQTYFGQVTSNSLFVAFNRMTVANAPLAFNQLLPAGLGFDANGARMGTFDYTVTPFGSQSTFPPLVDLNGDGATDLVLDAGRAISLIGTGRTSFKLPPTNLPSPGTDQQAFNHP